MNSGESGEFRMAGIDLGVDYGASKAQKQNLSLGTITLITTGNGNGISSNSRY
jgi:hypothetical protein